MFGVFQLIKNCLLCVYNLCLNVLSGALINTGTSLQVTNLLKTNRTGLDSFKNITAHLLS